ncbi:drebrin-like protein B isoform X2 [Vanacampus margaritifer]
MKRTGWVGPGRRQGECGPVGSRSPNRSVRLGRQDGQLAKDARPKGRQEDVVGACGGLGNMALNLSKNGGELMAAYKDVVDGRSDVNWALMTYEGNSNNLRVAGKGGGGLEEMVEQLNSGKVMYAFCRVQDTNSGLPKYVLVNWTGEGVKEAHKGLRTNHLGAVANFLKGAHVTINARDEDDVDPDVILAKVSKASGTDFNFHKPAAPQPGDLPRRGAVGSVYRKTNAVEEIQLINKDSFWSQSQREEELRREEEVKKAELQRQAAEQERRDLEEKRGKEREKQIHQRNVTIDHNRLLQKQREEEEREKEELRRSVQDAAENPSPGMRWARSAQAANEAQVLISQRSFNPRDIFKTREAAPLDLGYGGSAPKAGKLRSPFLSQQALDSPQPPLGHKTFPAWEPAMSIPPPETSPTDQESFQSFDLPAGRQTSAAQSVLPSWTPPSLPGPNPTSTDHFLSRAAVAAASSPVMPATAQAAAEDDDWSDEFDDDLYQAAPGGERLKALADAMFSTDVQDNQYAVPRRVGGAVPFQDAGQDAGQDADTARDGDGDGDGDGDAGQNIRAKAVYDYQAADDTEITFDPDDIITGIEMVDEGWWRGYAPDGHYGMFPANYVELL